MGHGCTARRRSCTAYVPAISYQSPARFSVNEVLTTCLRLAATTLSDADKQRIHQQVEALLPHSAYDFSQTLERIQHAVRRPCAVAAPG